MHFANFIGGYVKCVVLIVVVVFVVSLQKLHVFLFTELLVLTRPVTRNERQCFQVYRQPIPVHDLVLEDLQDGDVRMGGSFRGAFSNADKGEACARVKTFIAVDV